ncbi:hypothetical protein [Tsuneonella sp. HG222]
MTNAVIAPGMLMAVLALALGFHDARRAGIGLLLAVAATLLAVLISSHLRLTPIVLTACWLSLIATTGLVYWPRASARHASAVLYLACANAGLWSGLVVAAEDATSRLPLVFAPLLLVVPASLCVRRDWAIAPRVLASWLLAVAVLAAALPLLVSHPGYVPDHRM